MSYNRDYIHAIDSNTVKRLKVLTVEQWSAIIGDILEEKSIDFNIVFSENSPEVKLKDINNLLSKIRVGEKAFNTALVSKVISIYGKESYLEEIYIILSVISFTKPLHEYRRLEALITYDRYEQMLSITKDGFLCPHFYLINSVMDFDEDWRIYKFLKSLSSEKQPSEYYQIFIRYLYNYCNQQEFNDFMKSTLPFCSDEGVSHFVMLGLKEYCYYKHSYELIYYWMLETHESSEERHRDIFLSFNKSIKYNLLTTSGKALSYSYYIPFFILTELISGNKVMDSYMIADLIATSSKDFSNKKRLYYLIGRKIECDDEFVYNVEKELTQYFNFKDNSDILRNEADVAFSIIKAGHKDEVVAGNKFQDKQFYLIDLE
jgi:hypothetical protein